MTTLSSIARPRHRTQIFTASGSWTPPTGVNRVLVTACGGGGGGARLGSGTRLGGGSAGFIVRAPMAVTPGQIIYFDVGAAGTGYYHASTAGNASNGGYTIIDDGFYAVYNLSGGAGAVLVGTQYAGSGSAPNGSGGGYISSTSGESGACGSPGAGLGLVGTSVPGLGMYAGSGGHGAASPFPGYGQGGHGMYTTGSGNAGAPGIVILEWWA